MSWRTVSDGGADRSSTTELRVATTREQGLRRARALLRKYIPEGVNLSDELVAERRAEAARESEPRQ